MGQMGHFSMELWWGLFSVITDTLLDTLVPKIVCYIGVPKILQIWQFSTGLKWCHISLNVTKWCHIPLIITKWHHIAQTVVKWRHNALIVGKWRHNAPIVAKWRHIALIVAKCCHIAKIITEWRHIAHIDLIGAKLCHIALMDAISHWIEPPCDNWHHITLNSAIWR